VVPTASGEVPLAAELGVDWGLGSTSAEQPANGLAATVMSAATSSNLNDRRALRPWVIEC
jgi:hypothetical protein